MLKELTSMYNEHYCAKMRRMHRLYEQYQEYKTLTIKMNIHEPQLKKSSVLVWLAANKCFRHASLGFILMSTTHTH